MISLYGNMETLDLAHKILEVKILFSDALKLMIMQPNVNKAKSKILLGDRN